MKSTSRLLLCQLKRLSTSLKSRTHALHSRNALLSLISTETQQLLHLSQALRTLKLVHQHRPKTAPVKVLYRADED